MLISSWEKLAQCPREGCDGSQAFFYQVQIRSADEPMTTFYKVSILPTFPSRPPPPKKKSQGAFHLQKKLILLIYSVQLALRDGKKTENLPPPRGRLAKEITGLFRYCTHTQTHTHTQERNYIYASTDMYHVYSLLIGLQGL